MLEPPPRFLIPPGESVTGDEVLARFVLVEPVGEGGQGVVWRAEARGTGAPHAVKFIRRRAGIAAEGATTRARREVAALRLLRVPGLVRLVDAGDHEGALAIVMEWVAGQPFPGVRDGASWAALERPLTSLLETLQRLHAVGLVHRDLKPSNVLVRADGGTVLLDLGVAGGAALGAPGEVAGTPRYLPPEVLAGAPASAGDDLFALGVMAFEALAAAPLRSDPVADRASLARSEVLARLAGRAPTPMAELVAALVAAAPCERVATADVALQRLTGAGVSHDDVVARVFTQNGVVARAATHEAYRALFRARERIVDDRGHAARALFELAGGEPAAARRELAAWLRAGTGRVEGDAVRLVEHDLEWILERRATASARRRGLARALLDLGGEAEQPSNVRRAQLAALTAELARAVDEGAFEGALDEAPAGVMLALDLGDEAAYGELVGLWLTSAMSRSDQRALERLLHALERDGLDTDVTRAAIALARAAIAGLESAHERVEGLLAEVDPGVSARLGYCHQAIQQLVARSRGSAAAREALARARTWASGVGRPVPVLHTWEGWAHYVAGDFRSAYEAHLEAARLSGGEQRSTALLSAGVAAEFADRPDVALACALEVQTSVQLDRNLFTRIRARLLELEVLYAEGMTLWHDDDLEQLLEAPAATLIRPTGALKLAAIAWRRGEAVRARGLLERALESPNSTRGSSLWLLLRAFSTFLDGASERLERSDFELPGLVPGAKLQAAALLAAAPGAAALPFDTAMLAGAFGAVRGRDPKRRREILSLREVREWLAARGVVLPQDPEP